MVGLGVGIELASQGLWRGSRIETTGTWCRDFFIGWMVGLGVGIQLASQELWRG